jgi:hypothetical protein
VDVDTVILARNTGAATTTVSGRLQVRSRSGGVTAI